MLPAGAMLGLKALGIATAIVAVGGAAATQGVLWWMDCAGAADFIARMRETCPQKAETWRARTEALAQLVRPQVAALGASIERTVDGSQLGRGARAVAAEYFGLPVAAMQPPFGAVAGGDGSSSDDDGGDDPLLEAVRALERRDRLAEREMGRSSTR
eukprot:COSAG01_NODE_8009_length_2955_cov_61.934174_2_plen_157_part_00